MAQEVQPVLHNTGQEMSAALESQAGTCLCLLWSQEKAMAPHSSTLAWKIPWTEEPGGLQCMGSLQVGHDWATSLSCIGEGNGNPLQCSCLENPRDGGAWWAAVDGVAQSQTRLKRRSSSSSSSRSWEPDQVTPCFKCSKSSAKQANGNSAIATTSRWPFYQRCYPENTTNRLECKQHTFLINKEGWQLAVDLSLLIRIATVGIWEPFITYTCEQMSKETVKSMALLSMLQSTRGHIKNFNINPGLLLPSKGFSAALTSVIISLQLVQDLSWQSEILSFLYVQN